MTHPLTYLGTTTIFLALAGCGSGGDTAPPPATPPVQPAPPTLTLNATSQQTLAGGKSLTLTGATDSSSAPTWLLASGSVGSLSAASGASVSYAPPATVTANTPVTVTATVGGVSKSVALTVFPDPGAAGLSVITGRLNPSDLLDATADGPLATAHFRESLSVTSDLAGNLYVAGTCMQRQTELVGLTLRKIGIDGTVSTLASCEANTWFGAPDSALNLQKFTIPEGIAVDRAGNFYIGNYQTPAGGSTSTDSVIFKITPQGVLSVLAGALGSNPAGMKDGSGGTARFLTPTVAGIDSNDNLYVVDNTGATVREIDTTGNVTTVAALPASLTTDQNGNTYHADPTSGAITQTTPAGVVSTIANVNTLPGVLPGMTPSPYSLVRTGPVTFALLVSNHYIFPNEAVVQLVVPH